MAEPTLREQWIAALRSGKYPQGQTYLRCEDGFCCLGVLADLINPDEWSETEMSRGQLDWEGSVTALPLRVLPDLAQKELYARNDGLGEWIYSRQSFAQIADYIEAHPEIDPQWPPEHKQCPG